MATRITYNEVYVALGESVVVNHDPAAVLTVLAGEHSGGGADRRWLLSYVLATPIQDKESK